MRAHHLGQSDERQPARSCSLRRPPLPCLRQLRMTDLLVLSEDEVRSVLAIDELAAALIESLTALSQDRTSVPPRIAAFGQAGLLGAMPGYVPDLGMAAKLVSVFPQNPKWDTCPPGSDSGLRRRDRRPYGPGGRDIHHRHPHGRHLRRRRSGPGPTRPGVGRAPRRGSAGGGPSRRPGTAAACVGHPHCVPKFPQGVSPGRAARLEHRSCHGQGSSRWRRHCAAVPTPA